MLHLSRPLRRSLLLSLAALGLAVALAPKPTGAQAPKALEPLLKESGFDYVKAKEGYFKVVTTLKGDTSLLILSEDEITPDPAGKYKLITVEALVVEVPEKFKHPAAMLKKMAVLNDRFTIGKLSLDETTGNIYFRTELWLRTADADEIATELILAHINRKAAQKELEPFVEE